MEDLLIKGDRLMEVPGLAGMLRPRLQCGFGYGRLRWETGNRALEGNTINFIGLIYQFLGYHPAALDFYRRAHSIARALSDRRGGGSFRPSSSGRASRASTAWL